MSAGFLPFHLLPSSNLHPQEATDIGDLGGGGSQAGVGHLGDGGGDLIAVELVGVERVLLERVHAGVEGDGRRAGSGNLAWLVLGGGGRGGDGRGGKGQDRRLGELHGWATAEAEAEEEKKSLSLQ